MKKVFGMALVCGVLSTEAFAWLDCDRKLGILEQKINIARSYGNYNQAYGLQRAYDRILAKCSGYYYGGYNGGYIRDFNTANTLDTGRYYYENTARGQNSSYQTNEIYTELDYINEDIEDIDYEIKKLEARKQKLKEQKAKFEKSKPQK